jgi:L-rhamnose isomerase/sugar isomerase
MIDQSHNLKGKIEAMIQTVRTAQELWVKAALVDRAALEAHQAACSLVDAERCLTAAFATDTRPLVTAWATARGLPADPFAAFHESGYLDTITHARGARNLSSVTSYA